MISVIIPVYNVEKYIEDLIKSLINQKFKNFEMVIVNDGSTDNSIDVAEKILRSTNLVYKIINQENKGLSAARNTGIKYSIGEWVVWPDSDDVLHPGYLEKLYETVIYNKANCAYCNFSTIKDDENIFEFDESKKVVISMNSFECMKKYVKGAWIGPWSIIINRNFFIEKNLWFDEECRYCEDCIFITKLICEIDKIYEIPEALYYYRKRNYSILSSSSHERVISGFSRIILLKEFLNKNNSKAGSYFEKYGFGNWVLGTIRISSKKYNYKIFKLITKQLEAKKYIKKYIEVAPFKRKIAALIYVFSSHLFYSVAKTVH